MIFDADSGHRIRLSQRVRGRLAELSQVGPDDPECAGFLLGRIASHRTIEVVAITEPGPRCSGTRFGCYLDAEHHVAEIRKAWDESGGKVFAVGHWHTHPEPDPTPSQVDRDDWQRRLVCDDWAGLNYIVFAIVGTERMRMWLGAVGSSEIAPMHDAQREAA